MIKKVPVLWKSAKKKDIFEMAGNMLRVLVTGNVDNGKSTILGRLFYESELIHDDQLTSIYRDGNLDFSLFTDGLYQEIQEGVTYDIAHLFYQKSGKRIIFLDSPGHKKFAHNMIAACSQADVALILLDILEPLSQRTIDQINCAKFFDIKHYIYCINKMDLVGYSQDKYLAKVEEIKQHTSNLPLSKVTCLGVSAYEGEAISKASDLMPWQEKTSLIDIINLSYDTIVKSDNHLQEAIFEVQYAWYDPTRNVTILQSFKNTGYFDPSQKYYIPSISKWFYLDKMTQDHSSDIGANEPSFSTFSFMIPGKECIQRGDVLFPASRKLEPVKFMKVALLNLYDFKDASEVVCYLRLNTQKTMVKTRNIEKENNQYIAQLELSNPIYLDAAKIDCPNNRFILFDARQERILFIGKPLALENANSKGDKI